MKNKIELDLPNMKRKRVLITGGLGFIGSNLANICVKLGCKVTIYDNLDPRSGGNLYNINEIKNKVEIIHSDILNFDELSHYIVGKDILFNCAASTSHPFSMKEPWIDLDVNGRGVINILEVARRFNKDIKIVHLGTSTQLGKLNYKPADEVHPEFPMDIYSANKSVSEKYVLIYGAAYQMRVTVVRLPNVFGPRATIHSPEFNFVNYFIGLALQDKTITVYGDGLQLRNVLYIDDCVSALLMASDSNRVNGEVIFAVGDKHYSVSQISQMIVMNIGSGKVNFVDWPKDREVIEPGDALISNKKIKKILYWKPRYNFETGLILTRKYFNACLGRYVK